MPTLNKTCPICFEEKGRCNVICTECNDKGWIEAGIKISRIRDGLYP